MQGGKQETGKPGDGAPPPQGEEGAPPPREDARDQAAARQRRWQELTSPPVLLLLLAGALAFLGLGMPVPHLHWLIGAALGAGLFYAPRLAHPGLCGALGLIGLGTALLVAAVAWAPHDFISGPSPEGASDEVYPRKAFEIVVAGGAALTHGLMVLAWNLWRRGKREAAPPEDRER